MENESCTNVHKKRTTVVKIPKSTIELHEKWRANEKALTLNKLIIDFQEFSNQFEN